MNELNNNQTQEQTPVYEDSFSQTPLTRREQRQLKRRNRKVIKRERWATRSFPNKVFTVVFRCVIAVALIYGAMVLALGAFMRSDAYRHLANDAYDTLARMSDGNFRKLSNTKFLDKDGALIGEVDSGSYVYATIDQIPKNLQDAYVSIEDKNYKVHQGVDYTAIARATWELIKHRGEITQGGSTITQQVIKNNLLTSEQTFSRKFTEILLAPNLEKKYNKAEIMEFYCNSNYYGNGCYGVQSASKFYFGKDCREMTLAECAMMAGISNSPNRNNPVADYDRSRKKMTSVLNKMLEQHYITKEEYHAAIDADITITQTETTLVSSNNYMCSFAMHYAALELMKQDGFKFRYRFNKNEDYEKYRKKYEKKYASMASKIREGGYTIRTSFDQKAQKKLQDAINKTLSGSVEKNAEGQYILQSAGVCYDNKTGMIIAAVGGRGDAYNRAFLAQRQPGSSIKPLLVYTPALNEGSTNPSAILDDHKIYAVPGDKDSYSPKNANNAYLGKMTVREALARSTNTIAFQLYSTDYLDYLAKMGFSSLVPADNSALSVCLGGFTYGVTVSDMARGYATLANYGLSPEKTCLLTVEHEQDGTVYDASRIKAKRIYENDAAFMMTDMMEGVFLEKYGTCAGMDIGGQIIAGKTGTTNSNRDAWLCGYTPYYTTAVWVGREDNAVLNQGTQYSKNIFSDFMTAVHKDKKAEDFKVPDSTQYRQIKDGKYTKDTYDKKKLDMSKRSYRRRPKGYEYYSEKCQENKKKSMSQGQKVALEEAKKAVAKFEKYTITDIESALGFEAAYSKAFALVDALPDGRQKTKLLERLQKQYETLESVMLDSWKELIDEKEAQDIQKAQQQSKLDAENSKIKAQTSLHDMRIARMEWYLDVLSSRKYNTATTQQILADAWAELDNCASYSEYNSLRSDLQKQEERVNALPTTIPSDSANAADEKKTYDNEN